MRYTEEELFDFMDSGRRVRVTCTDGQVFVGRCWAYSSLSNEEDFGIDEATIDIECGVMLKLSEIESIEVC